MYSNIAKIISLLFICFIVAGCTKTITETKIEYVKPEIPASIIEPCEQIQATSFKTNGELLMAYISLQSSYVVCAAKVTSIANILSSYDVIYTSDEQSK